LAKWLPRRLPFADYVKKEIFNENIELIDDVDRSVTNKEGTVLEFMLS